ncbi:DGQHR domain-containing protein [Variovorax sp. RB2P76]|uniref:DGQHR domain-containing protein n=1 Tax=Variovorax sp. RB2P76 TaxID=3443736 RepID=UPI003F4461C0
MVKKNPAVKKSTVAESTKKSYVCSSFSQRTDPSAPAFCVFAASAGDVLQWADIERLGPGVKGVQRRENVAKRRQITRFFKNTQNTIPTAIIVALDDSQISADSNELTINIKAGSKKPGLIIDGQHRLLGISDFDEKIKVPIVAIMNASDTEKAFQFLVINNKGSKVSQNHIKALSLSYKPKDLSQRLSEAKIALDNDRLGQVDIINTFNESPFKNRVNFPTTKGKLKKIVPEAFEKALQYIESLNLPKLEDTDIQRDFFLTIWRSVVKAWGSAIFTDDCKLTEKVGVISMSKFLVDRLAARADIEEIDLDLSDLEEVGKEVEKLLNRQTLDFWMSEWKGSGYDTSIGHAKVIESLIKISRNIKDGKEWEIDVDIFKSR